jgi:FkbM family methyltransferase
MVFEELRAQLRKRARKKEYRRIVKQFYADGGDYKFRFDYDLAPNSVVLDLGGYEGQWASDLYSRYRCKIHVFEPVAAFAERISQRFRKNIDIEVHACGLGARSRKEVIHVRGASSSLYKDKGGTEEIEIVDVSEWFGTHRIGSVALMKINIEGGEYELLERLIETRLIESIDDVQVQFHNFTDDASERMAAIQEHLGKTHALTYQYRFVWENWKRRGQ